MSFSRSAYEKSCDGFVPQETDFKRLALVLSSASACKKLAMASSLKTVFQKMPMAIFHDPQTQQRQASPCSHSPQRGG